MRASMGAASRAARMAGRARALAASAFMPVAAAMASSQAAVPSTPTGPEPMTGRPAARNSRTVAV